MKLKFVLAACVTLFTTPVFAAERYFSLAAGSWLPGHTSTVDYNFRPVDVSYDAGWSIDSTIGIALDNGLRLENELVYRQAAPKTSADDMWALGWLVNIWWDGRNSSPFTPYLGGGFGFGRGHVSSPGPVINSGSGIAYQAGGGMDYKIDHRLSLDVGYRYFGISDTSSNGGIVTVDLEGSSFLAGIRYKY